MSWQNVGMFLTKDSITKFVILSLISPIAGNLIMYKNREIKIEKSDDLDKIVRKTNLINKKVMNVNESI